MAGECVCYAPCNLLTLLQILNCGGSEEGDPIIHTYFKTELTTHLLQQTQGSINVTLAPTLEYSKKKDKRAQMKFIKDETVRKDDLYKSHTVHVPSGEPAGSLSKPPAKRKAGVVRPITAGKLLKKGGPSDVCAFCLCVSRTV